MNNKFKTKAGRLTPYSFMCGYIEQIDKNNKRVTLWHEHNTYHVRAHDFSNNTRLVWDTYKTLTEARNGYSKAKKQFIRGQKNE